MLVTQVAASALAFPYLMRSWPAAVAVALAAWPFVVIAGVLSGTPTAAVIRAASYVMACLIALGAVNAALPERSRSLAVAAATLLCVGGPVLFYLDVEFARGDGPWTWISPTLAVLRHVRGDASARDWLLPATIASIAVAAVFLRRRSSQVIHNS